ncbi:MAG: flippase activity-associated protein Agl23 [Bacteroidota bacterium]
MAVIFFALFLRTNDLDTRPLHVDEAVHAVKFGELLEKGFYKYDPVEYHGPTLNYFTLISSSLSNVHSFKELTEYTIRIVPAITSIVFILIVAFFFRQKEFSLNLLIIFLLSISSVFVFYSRYYIQEVLLVSYTYIFLILLFEYLSERKFIHIVLVGIFAGLIFATKETSIIVFGVTVVSLIILYFLDTNIKQNFSYSINHLLMFIISALAVSILFYSSFFSNYEGILDSLKTFSNYFTKAAENIDHVHPWYYYIDLLIYTNNDKIFYTDLFILLFAFGGMFYSFFSNQDNKNTSFFRFISIYSLFQFIIYSAIPYKTPWLVLNFWIGFLFLSAFGIFQTYLLLNKRLIKVVYLSIVSLVLINSLWQTFKVNFEFPYQPENPFTYSQATMDVVNLSEKINSLAETTIEQKDILINVVAPNDDYWPLPWYLRKFNNVAWNSEVKNSVYKFPIIISVPAYEEKIIEKLYTVPPSGQKNLYIPLIDDYHELRPGIEIRSYIQKDILDIYLRNREESK